MADTIINLGDTNPDQQTVTTGGNYGVDISVLAVNPTITFSGPSLFNLDSVAGLLSGYTVEATNGATVNINGLATAASAATLNVNGASTILLTDTVSALSVITANFTGAGGGTLSFAPGLLNLLSTVPTVTGFGTNDNINFGSPFAAGDQAVYSAATGLLSLTDATGAAIGTVKLNGTFAQSNFAVADNSAGQAVIDFACFLRGTSVLTADGPVAVELLQAGDQVMTLAGPMPVKAVRIRSFGVDKPADQHAQPIRIAADAIADSKPARDLFVSPDHAMFIDGVLVPASLLQNGRTVTQAQMTGRIDYFHVEIEPHGILFAEGAETESYLDIGNRNHFMQSGAITLFPEQDPKTWEDACAPLILAGPKLEGIRRNLAARAVRSTEGVTLDRVA